MAQARRHRTNRGADFRPEGAGPRHDAGDATHGWSRRQVQIDGHADEFTWPPSG